MLYVISKYLRECSGKHNTPALKMSMSLPLEHVTLWPYRPRRTLQMWPSWVRDSPMATLRRVTKYYYKDPYKWKKQGGSESQKLWRQSRGHSDPTAGFADGEWGQEPRKSNQPLKLGKDKEKHCSLEPPEGGSLDHTWTLARWDPFWTELELWDNKCVLL